MTEEGGTLQDRMPSEGRQRIAVLMGPTGVGKTALAVDIARGLGAEIVCADSMTVYRHLDIGTAKPSAEERAAVPHHLIDVVDPDQPFSAADFRDHAGRVLADLHRRGVPALVVGGTGLYVRALVRGLFAGPAADLPLRARLEADEAAEPGVLHRRLQEVDGEAAARLHPRDLVRLIRALEVYTLTGRPLSDWLRDHHFSEAPYDALQLGLTLDAPTLDTRLDRRVDQMMERGLRAEVEGLLARGYGPELKPMKGLGYLHLCGHLVDGVPLDEALRTLKRDHRRFARRQITWMRGEPGLQFHPAVDRGLVTRQVSDFLMMP